MHLSTSFCLHVLVILIYMCILDFLLLGTWCMSSQCLIGQRVNSSYFWYPAIHSLSCAEISFHPYLTLFRSAQSCLRSPTRLMKRTLQRTCQIIHICTYTRFGHLGMLEALRGSGNTACWIYLLVVQTPTKTNVWCETETIYINILHNHKIISENINTWSWY